MVDDAASDHAQAKDLNEAAGKNREDGQAKADESNRLRRNGREQSLRGLKNLADGSDRYAESFAGTEKGLSDLQTSLDGLKAAHQSKGEGLETINQGLTEQSAHNLVQSELLEQLQDTQAQDSALNPVKASQLGDLNANIEARKEGVGRQLEGFGDFLIAGGQFDDGSAVKREGFGHLGTAAEQTVKSEHLKDARDHKNVETTWAETDQKGHGKAGRRLYFDSIFHSLKSKADKLTASHLEAQASQTSQTAEGVASQGIALKAQAAAMLRNARHMEQCGQNHVVQGRQMQCCPFTYHQGRALEHQGHCEIAEAQRQKQAAQQLRAEGQAKAMEAEELRVQAEQTLAKGEEFEVEGHGSQVRSEILHERSQEHRADSIEAGQAADRSREAASQLDASARELQASASEQKTIGQGKISEGVSSQNSALEQQAATTEGLNGEFATEQKLSTAAKVKTGEAVVTVAKTRSFIRRSERLTAGLGASHTVEQSAQAKIQEGIGQVSSGLDSSKASNAQGKEATKLLEEARDLELEGLRLQNRGQKMMLEARPKMAAAARLSAESFDHKKTAESQEEEAAKLIEQGNQKLAAAEILRNKANGYREIAG